jgi:hypothetical protein
VLSLSRGMPYFQASSPISELASALFEASVARLG